MKPRNPKKSKKLKRGSSSSVPPSPPWTELPDDLTANILQRLYTEEIIESAQYVCTTWWRVCQNPATWRFIDLDYRRPTARDFGNICRCGGCVDYEICLREGGCKHNDICRCWDYKFEYLVRRAVDLSQGQLLHLKLGVWDLYDALNYVADRSCRLRCLTFLQCDDYDLRRLIVGIKKQPQLEELHLMMNPMFTSNEFETIGIACPMLKSFSYHNCHSKDSDFSEHAKAIGKTMPNLRHLRLCEDRMGYEGLEAILHGCPHLKSLDLRPEADLHGAIFGLRLCSAFEKFHYYSGRRRSARERKDLWLHTDSISLVDWIKKRKDSYDIDSENVIHRYYCCDDIRGEYY